EEVCDWLKEKEIEFQFYQDYYLHDTQDVRKQDNKMYKVFTPYYKQWRTLKKPQVLQIDLKKVKKYALEISTSLNSDKEF
ncbi:deoxyribodipyrimidine photo-lyase, partial [Micrococcus sp. SIMBA_131]